MSAFQLNTLSSKEYEFLAESTLITIVPSGNYGILQFVSGTFGPLEAGLPADVPLWLAVTLRKKGKCIISPPSWLSVEFLEKAIYHERSSKHFADLPFHYVEIGKLLLNNAKEDIEDAERIFTLLEDLQYIRMNRIQNGFDEIISNLLVDKISHEVDLRNIAAMELYAMKSLMLDLFDMMKPLSGIEVIRQDLSRQSVQAPTTRPNLRKYR